MSAMHYDLTTLPNGLRVITEAMPSLRSVAVGCWVDTGTRDEDPNEAGASHFLEHLLFKGSEMLSAREISERFDAMGAESNAFTSKDHTCFWARLLDENLEEGLGILGEMLQRPAFRGNEIDAERHVVVEEINMSEDDPSDVAFEQFTRAVFAGHPLEEPVLGTRESILGMTRDDIAGYWKRRYGVGSTEIMGALARVRQPFNVNSVAQAAALAALDDVAHVERSRALAAEGRRYYAGELDRLGLSWVPSQANFVLVEVGHGAAVCEHMLRSGVIVRPMDAYGMPAHVRITFGAPAENARCIAALESALGELR